MWLQMENYPLIKFLYSNYFRFSRWDSFKSLFNTFTNVFISLVSLMLWSDNLRCWLTWRCGFFENSLLWLLIRLWNGCFELTTNINIRGHKRRSIQSCTGHIPNYVVCVGGLMMNDTEAILGSGTSTSTSWFPRLLFCLKAIKRGLNHG